MRKGSAGGMAAAAAAAAALGVALAAAGRRLRGRRIPEGPRLPFTARLVAHRGGAGERIENTLEAFEHAVSCGADWLELDVRRTKDGVPVVFHDQDLARACGTPGAIRDLNYEELPPYRCPLEVTFSPGQFSTGSDRRIPRLEEVFQRFPRQPISVEVKDDDEELINEVAALVRAYDRAPITIWASFQEPILAKCRRAHPSMPYCFSLRRGLLLLLLYYCRLLPWVPLGEAVLLFVLPGIINRTYFPVPKGWMGKLLRRVVEMFVFRRGLLMELRARGIQVVLWVLNDQSDFSAAFRAGATGVVTDYPARLRRFLDSGHAPPATPLRAPPPASQ